MAEVTDYPGNQIDYASHHVGQGFGMEFAPPDPEMARKREVDAKTKEFEASGYTLSEAQKLAEYQYGAEHPQETGFMAGLSAAEEFAADTGWQVPLSTIRGMMGAGIEIGDRTQVFKYLARVSGLGAKFPWLANGLTQKEYQQSQRTIADTLFEQTGSKTEFGDLQAKALANGWSTTDLITELQSNKAYWKAAPWLQERMSYGQWADYKQTNKAQAASRFGENNLTDANYLKIKQDAAQSRQMSGGAFQQPAQQNSLVQQRQQSQVR